MGGQRTKRGHRAPHASRHNDRAVRCGNCGAELRPGAMCTACIPDRPEVVAPVVVAPVGIDLSVLLSLNSEPKRDRRMGGAR